MTVQFRSRIPSVIDYAAEIKSVGVCCYLGDDGKMTSVESTQIECYTLKGHFQFGDINEISCDEVADTGCCCSCSEASKHQNVEEYEAFLDAAANSADDNCLNGPDKPAWGDGIGLKSNTTQCQCDKLGGKWTAGDCPTIFNNDVTHKDGVRTRCYVPGTIVPLEYKYYCTGTGSCASCLSTNCPDDGTLYYTDKAECDQYCTDPVRWDCCEGKCYSANDATLPYATKEQCQAVCPRLICGIENNQRKCITTFNDPKGTNGSFGNLPDCLASCIQDVKGRCCLSSTFNYHHSCRTVTTPDECVNRTGPGHWTLFQYHKVTANEANGLYTATYTPGKTMCGPISPFLDPACSVRTPLGYNNQGHCFGYNNTDPIIFDNAKFTMEWDCYENGGADWVGLLSQPQAQAAALTLKPNWFCIDGTCTQRYTMPGATYPYPTGISYANEAACLLVGCTPESPTPPQCNTIATGRCCGTGNGSGSGSGGAVIDPTGPVNPITVNGQEYPHRVTRGGPACGYGSFYVRSSFRDESAHYQTRGDGVGFRVARTPGPASDLWYTELEVLPDSAVVTDANLRAAITATGLPWRIRATPSNIEMVLIPKGTFTMGCSPSTATWWPGCETTGELPKHQVTLTKSFYISRTPVTQAQWTAVIGSNPSFYNNVQQNGFTTNTDRPVEMVSWEDVAGAGGFMSQTNFRLPTEAEWEYAYRAGTTTAFHGYPAQPNGFNDDIDGIELRKIAWFGGNIGNCGQIGTSAYGTKAVGLKLANGFGLYDMSGNVFEWCQDWYAPYGGGGGCNQNGCTVTNKAGCLPPCTWTEVSDGTDPCGPNACGPSVQTACCYVAENGDKTCTPGMTEAQCTTLNGVFEIGVSSCSSCDPFVGKCCKTNGDCIDNITKAACLLQQFGTWTQFGNCTPNTCPVTNPIGICCTNGATPACSTTTESDCAGTWINTSDDCSSACPCCPCTTGTTIPQRCCTTSAGGIVTCESKTVIDCLNGRGAPSGIGTGCISGGSGTSCDDPIQCCTPSNCTGTNITAMECKAQNGVPSSGQPCCVTCCYDQDTLAPKCELIYSTALCDADKRCTDQLGGRVITSPDTCTTCVSFKWKCQADGTCIQSSDGIYTSDQDCLSNCVLGGCCELGAVCRNSVKADCVFGSWGALCEFPPQLCPDDVIIIVDPCEGFPPSTTTAYCKGEKKTIDCPDCCAELVGFEKCLTECARNGACGPGTGGSQEFPSFSGRDNIVPEAACQIDVRIPRACCYIEYDPTFGPVGMTCDNVCSSAECEKLKTVSNSKHPAVYSGGAICPSRRLASSGPTLDCDSSIHLSLTNRSFYAGIPFGTCWTLGLTAQYSCDVSDESACGVVNGYWVSLETSEGQMCDSTYRPQPINISTQRIIEPETMNDSEFQSLGLEFGDFYKGGYYIGTYSPGAPITQFGSSLYGSLNLTAPITSPSTAYGNGENVVTKWALIVEPYTYRTSFLNETEPRILLPHSKLSKYDGFYNCYGNAGFGGLRSSLTNSVLGRNRRGFPDYYLPSIQELMFFAFQINDFSTDNYIKYISIFKNDLLNNMPTYLSSTSIGDTSLYSQYLQPVDRYSFGNISTSTLTSVNTVKFFRRINLT